MGGGLTFHTGKKKGEAYSNKIIVVAWNRERKPHWGGGSWSTQEGGGIKVFAKKKKKERVGSTENEKKTKHCVGNTRRPDQKCWDGGPKLKVGMQVKKGGRGKT